MDADREVRKEKTSYPRARVSELSVEYKRLNICLPNAKSPNLLQLM